MDHEFSSLIRDFVDETTPLIEQIGKSFLEIERLWKLKTFPKDIFPSVLSDLHTVKGNSAMMGFTPIQSVAHAMEDLCVVLQKKTFESPDTASLLLEGGDLLLHMIQEAPHGEVEEGPAQNYVQKINQHTEKLNERRKSPERRTGQEWRTRKDRRETKERRNITAPKGSSTSQREKGFGKTNDTIRIDFQKLDTLLETVGEGVIAHSALVESHRQILNHYGNNEEISSLEQTILLLGKNLKDLQRTLMDARLLPMSSIFSRFPRVVRDLSVEMKKTVSLSITGEETRLDKRIIDRIGEPLLHLIRNTMAHGIEETKERISQGKKEEGTISLSAQQLSDRVVVTIQDDGRGLDIKKIKKKAKEDGIDVDALSEEEVKRLIFRSGLSTQEHVSKLAGRGVGLDVVAHIVSQLGGSVDVSSKEGEGTRFDLNLPLTVTLLRCLLVEVDTEVFAIPLSEVVETARTTHSQVHQLSKRNVLRWRGEVVPISDLGDLMGTVSSNAQKRGFFVFVATSGQKRAMRVDRVLGHQDVVAKQLDDFLGKPDVISGGTILGNGQVVFMLDVPRIIEQGIFETRTVQSNSFEEKSM